MTAGDRTSIKLDNAIHAELSMLALDYGIGLGELTDILLEYATASVDHIDEALEHRKARGSASARKRREAP